MKLILITQCHSLSSDIKVFYNTFLLKLCFYTFSMKQTCSDIIYYSLIKSINIMNC